MIVEDVLKALGLEYKVNSKGEYIAPCPFARWTHEDGDDKHPSFGILPVSADDFVFNCFTCGLKGNSYTFFAYAEKYGLRVYGLKKERKYVRKEYEELVFGKSANACTYTLQSLEYPYEPMYHRYLEKRGIRKETASNFKLSYDGKKRAIVLPTISVVKFDPTKFGKEIPMEAVKFGVVGWSYRFIDKKGYIHIPGFPRNKALFGEHLCFKREGDVIVRRGGDIILVEGFFDAMRLRQIGYNACAIMGTVLSEAQALRVLNFLCSDLRQRVCIFMDGDLAGYQASETLKRVIGDRYKSFSIKTPPGFDPADLTDDDLKEILNKYEVEPSQY